MEIQYWPISGELKKEAESNYRTQYANSLKEKDPLTIIRELTFDGVVPEIEVKDIKNLLTFIQDSILKKDFFGVGVEVGSGPLVFSSMFANHPKVSMIYGVELCESVIKNLADKIISYIAPKNKEKVIPAVGSFDGIALPDESVDFIFDFYSLHHSPHLDETIKGLYKLIKPNGYLLCLDKARPDTHTEGDLSTLVEKEYEDNYKKQFKIPLDQKLTRKMNGETEHRLKDWKRYLSDAGFKKVEYYYLDKTTGGGWAGHIKKIISFFSPSIQKRITSFLPKPHRKHLFTLETKNRIFTRYLNPFRKEISLIIAYK